MAMKLLRTLVVLAVAVIVLVLAAGLLRGEERPARDFFGIAPQTAVTPEDVRHMEAGGIGTMRWPFPWEAIQPDADGPYAWAGIDEVVASAARGRIRVLPVLYGSPAWLRPDAAELPVEDEDELAAWSEFVRAAVDRYGRGGDFWRARRAEPGAALPYVPIREWQIWNEANFHYFTTPVSPSAYAELVLRSGAEIHRLDPGARVVLSGLFGAPADGPPRGMPAATFLDRLYAVDGVEAAFDGAALHAYAKDVETLEALTEEMRETMDENGDEEADLYVTEVGWGSQADSHVSFERGTEGQERELRNAYEYLVENRDLLNLESVYWFTWKDLAGACDFCDSAGLFHEGEGFDPKPAWEAFVAASGGRTTP